MSNYKWVTDSYDGKPARGYTHLRGENFEELLFPRVPSYSMDDLLSKELFKSGIYLELEVGYGFNRMSHYYKLLPTNIQTASITAPLYKESSTSAGYEKVSDSYTGTTIDPIQKEWVKEEFQQCQQAVKQAQADEFKRIFSENSLDGGLTACIEITSRIINLYGRFCERYVPDSFFKICRLTEPSLTGPNGDETAIFMKKMDVHGKVVTIKVPERFKGLVIGTGGETIKRVASIINARRINVI